jgi:hypothetical protein
LEWRQEESEVVELASQEERKAVEWLLEPYERFREYGSESVHLIYVGMAGITRLVNLPNLEKALIEYDVHTMEAETWNEEQTRRHAESKMLAAFAKKEIDEVFPLLIAHSLVGLWGALEASFDDFLFVWLRANPTNLRNAENLKFKVSAKDLLGQSNDDRVRWILHELNRGLGADFKKGVARFEEPLNCVGLGGEVDADTRRVILEMQQLRHVWAHLGGQADRRFRDVCPWVEVDVGTRARVSPARFADYTIAALEYFAAIVSRALKSKGLYLERNKLYRLPIPELSSITSTPSSISEPPT